MQYMQKSYKLIAAVAAGIAEIVSGLQAASGAVRDVVGIDDGVVSGW